MTLKVAFRQTEVQLTGKVVRVEEVDSSHRTVWRYQVALVIDPCPALRIFGGLAVLLIAAALSATFLARRR